MNAEIICVGTELLLGNIVNTNAVYLSRKLSELGINVFYQTVVGDNANRLKESLQTGLSRSDIIILTGGLGPTSDDITKEIVARQLGLPLVNDVESRNHINEYFASQNRMPVQSNYKQSLSPKGAVVLPNSVGTAPGYCIEKNNRHIILLPGPPNELQAMFESSVFRYLGSLSDSKIVTHYVRLFGIGESEAEQKLGNLTKNDNPTVATYAGDGGVLVRVTAKAHSAQLAEHLCTPIITKLKATFNEHIYAFDEQSLEEAVTEKLASNKMTVATAESCTGGMLSQKITSVPGSSEVFKMGVIAYSDEIKRRALHIEQELLDRYTAVSEYTAAQMAINVRRLQGASLGIGITGVAGPDKSNGKKVGLVYVALADGENVWVRRLQLFCGYDRDKIRSYATATALDLIRRYLYFMPGVMPGACKQGDEIVILEKQPCKFTGQSEHVTAPVTGARNPNAISDEKLRILMADSFMRVSDDEPEADTRDLFKAEAGAIPASQYPTGDLLVKESSALESTEDAGAAADAKPLSFGTANFINDTADVIATKGTDDDEVEAFSLDSYSKKSKAASRHTKKSGFFKGIWAHIISTIPNRNSSVKENILKSVFLVALAGLIVSSVYLGIYFINGNQQKQIIEDVRNLWYSEMEQNSDFSFDRLLEINPDTKAWLKISNTNIDNPVCQTVDNDYYINHNFNKKKSSYGTLFFDYRDIIGEDGTSKNLVIYGHSMRDGSMFANLLKYKNIGFYKQNPDIELTTQYEKASYKIFSVFLINSAPEDDNGYIYNFLRNGFTDNEHFLSWIAESRQRSLINTTVDVTENDEILTLVTCAYDFNDARLVVMARKTRSGESAVTNTQNAVINPSPRYPQIWYTKKGLENPYTDSVVPSPVASSVIQDSSTDIVSEPVESTPSESSSAASSGSAVTRPPVVSSTPQTPAQSDTGVSSQQQDLTESSQNNTASDTDSSAQTESTGSSQGNE